MKGGGKMADDTEEISLSYQLNAEKLETLAEQAGIQAGELLGEAMTTTLLNLSGIISSTFDQMSIAAQALSTTLTQSLGQTAGQAAQSMSGQFQTAFGSAIGFVDQLISGAGKINTVATTFKSFSDILGSSKSATAGLS